MKRFILSILVVFVSSAQAWFWDDKSFNDYKNDFKERVYEVKEQKNNTAIQFKKTEKLIFDFKSLLAKSKKENVKFESLYNAWSNSQAEVKDLNIKFINLVESADMYFQEAKIKANSINDEKIKASVVKKIIISENKYINRLKNTRKGLIQLTVAIQKVKDIITFLEITSSLSALDEELNSRFSEIDTILDKSMKDFDKLFVESQGLFNE